MGSWIKVVTNPLGLVAFTLFLLFQLLKRTSNRADKQRLFRVFSWCSILVLAASLIIAYHQVSRSTDKTPDKLIQQHSVNQETRGEGSPAVSDVQGDVTITVDQSSGGKKETKPRRSQPKPAQPSAQPDGARRD